MADGAEFLPGRGADALGGGVGGDQVGAAVLEVLEFLQQPVILVVGDDRVVQDIVAVVVEVELLAQLGAAVGSGLMVHDGPYLRTWRCIQRILSTSASIFGPALSIRTLVFGSFNQRTGIWTML